MMNIETLLQAAQILESQQSIPPKKRLARGDPQTTPNNHIPTSVLSSTTINTNPTITPPPLPSSSLLIKNEHLTEYPQCDLNLNLHHFNHLVQQQSRSSQQLQQQQHFTSDQTGADDDDDDDDDQNIDGNSEISNRNQTACFRDREIHNRLEKHRRAHLKGCFDNLKAEVPCQRDRKITNLQVLNLAIKYIQNLSRKEREYDQEIALLTSRNIELQQRLRALKTDLNSEGHNVDTWLDSCSDIDRSVSTRTASEAEMYRTFDDDDDDMNSSTIETKLTNGHDDLDTNNNHHDAIDSKILLNNRKNTTRQRPRPSKRKLSSIPTTNLLQSLSTSIPTRSENLLDYNIARHLHLDQPCNLLTSIKDNLSSTTLTPITDIRYEIVDLFTKGTNSHLQQQQQQQQQSSPLPSIASLMNRHSSPIVSPTKQTIGINTDPLTTSTTNILHQPVATS
ncbi:unnamed protein product [Adineta steineri]|uniref:BHLH domain-containing protein n=2 Tax=Adineta steineri TaxID=433720 RepID=A0A819LX48_9BILA|nr:unnamed protein product [Adineta steineri]